MKRVSRKLPHLLIITLIAATSSCASTKHKRELYSTIPGQIQAGTTSKENVLVLLGEPTKKALSASGEVWTYGNASDSYGVGARTVDAVTTVGSIFVPYVGTASSLARIASPSSRKSHPNAMIYFGHDGLVRDYNVNLAQQ